MILRLFVLLAVFAFAAPVAHAKPPAPAIAIVDVDLILRDSTAAKNIREQMEKHDTTFRNEIQQQENALRAADQELAQKKAILAPEAFQSQVQDFQKRVAALGELVQKRKKQLDDAFNGAQKQLRDALGEVIQAQMKEQGLNMVLPRAVVFEMSKEMDITQETLRRLNQRLPQVKVVISTN